MQSYELMSFVATLALAGALCVYMYRETKVARSLVEAYKKANYDGLTGTLNRSAFKSALETAFFDKNNLHLLYIDLVNFKSINDTSGHEVGDEVLKSVGRFLVDSFPEDTPIAGRSYGEPFSRFGD